MERAISTRGPSNQERGIGTANGFIAIVLGLALLAGGGWMVLQSLAARLSGLGQLRPRASWS